MNRLYIILTLIAGLFVQTAGFAQGINEEYGKASYYADNLHGRPTASGAPYDKNKLTCAHKTLPFGTKIRVTRLDNQRSVVVEVTDRGPHREGFVVDVSRRAAEELDMIRVGVTRVRVEQLDKVAAPDAVGSRPADPTPASGNEMAGNVRLLKPHTPTAEAPATTNGSQTRSTPAAKPVQPVALGTNGTPPATNTLKSKSAPNSSTARTDNAPPATITTSTTTAKSAPTQPAAKTAAAPQQTAPKASSGKIRELYQVSMRRPAKEGFAVQLTALSNVQTSMDEISRLEAAWPGQIMVILETDESLPGQSLFKLLVGPFTDRKEADLVRDAIAKKGYKKAFVIALHEI